MKQPIYNNYIEHNTVNIKTTAYGHDVETCKRLLLLPPQ